MNDLDLYVKTVRELGVPASARHKKGEFILEGPFTKLDSEAMARFEENVARHMTNQTEGE